MASFSLPHEYQRVTPSFFEPNVATAATLPSATPQEVIVQCPPAFITTATTNAHATFLCKSYLAEKNNEVAAFIKSFDGLFAIDTTDFPQIPQSTEITTTVTNYKFLQGDISVHAQREGHGNSAEIACNNAIENAAHAALSTCNSLTYKVAKQCESRKKNEGTTGHFVGLAACQITKPTCSMLTQ